MNFLYIAHIPFVLLFLAFTIGLVFRALLSRDRPVGRTPRSAADPPVGLLRPNGAVKGNRK